MLIRFSNGNELRTFVDCGEPAVPDDDPDVPLTWAMVVVKKGERYVLHHNFNRKQWENPGGGWEDGETLMDCAIRETWEETSQNVVDLQCRGVFKLYLQIHDRCEYGALYTGTIEELLPFQINNESDRLVLWHPDDELDDRLSELSQWMIEYSQKY